MEQKFWHWKRIVIWIIIVLGTLANYVLWKGTYDKHQQRKSRFIKMV